MKPGMWFAIAAALGVVGVILAVSLFGSGMSPSGFVDKRYARTSAQGAVSGAEIYTSDEPTTKVVADIVDEWRPVSQYADGSGVYLRYSRDAIVVKPRVGGSTIEVMDARRAYGLYFAHVGGVWGWTSTHGEGFRGRGPGGGK